jgi:hypothetical protein
LILFPGIFTCVSLTVVVFFGVGLDNNGLRQFGHLYPFVFVFCNKQLAWNLCLHFVIRTSSCSLIFSMQMGHSSILVVDTIKNRCLFNFSILHSKNSFTHYNQYNKHTYRHTNHFTAQSRFWWLIANYASSIPLLDALSVCGIFTSTFWIMQFIFIYRFITYYTLHYCIICVVFISFPIILIQIGIVVI